MEKGISLAKVVSTGQPLRLATATAMNDLEVMRFDNAAIQRVLHEEPEFSELFISHLLSRNARVEADLVDQLFNSSEKRLARMLLLMANFGKEGKPETVIAKISQETLAEMIGTTRSRVSSFMNKFRKLGFIEYNGDLKVHNSLLNVILHDAPAPPARTGGCVIQFFSSALYKTAQSLPPPLVNILPSASFTGVRWLRVGCAPALKEGWRLCPATPENVVSKRRNACASLRKRLLTQRDKITPRSPTHGRSSRTCSRAIMPCLKA